MMREHLSLSGAWRFQPDPYNEGEGGDYAGELLDASRWRAVGVPSVFDACGTGLAGYEGTGWFRRTFSGPKAWAGKRVALRFEGVNYHAAV
jgi:beta-galactosidase/beta-glucuronidase